MEIKLVKAERPDWNTLLKIDETQKGNTYYYSLSSIEEIEKVLGKSVIYLIRVDGEVAGDLSYEINYEHKEAEINGLVVLPEYQNKKIGSNALKQVLEELESMGLRKIWLVTHPENSKAITVYLKSGFIIKEWHSNYFGDGQPRIKLEKKLI